MEILNFVNSMLRNAFIAIITFYVFSKSTNYSKITKKELVIMLFSSIFVGFLYALLSSYIPSLFILPIIIIIISIVISFISKLSIEETIIISFISMSISIAFYIVSLSLVLAVIILPIFNIDKQNTIILLFTAIIECIMVNRFFHIPRFKHGFSFLKSTHKFNNFSIVGLVLSGILIIIYSTLKGNENYVMRRTGLVGFSLIIIGIFIWIKRNITLDYQDRMKNRKIENLEKELKDKEKVNAELTEEIKNLTIINHKYNSRIKAAKQEIEKLAFAFKNSSNTEFGNEISEVTKLIDDLSNEYSNKINDVLKYSKPLPKTNVKGVDTILEHMKLEAAKNNIDFDLKVNCSVRDFTDKYISLSDLETLIGDHIKDAIIAINHTDKSVRNIAVIFDIINNCYRFSVYDSGIDFEIDTLVNLGLEATTTHKDEGGTGIGFMTTFETLEKYNASLVIDEINFKNSNFSKSINIVFDGKHEYVICSSRTEEIKKIDKSNRIILKEKKL